MSLRRLDLVLPLAALLCATSVRPALAWSCTVAETFAMTTTPGCVHGAPVRSGELLLVPRICRMTVQGRTLDRHTVDVRNGATGARIGQASMPGVEPATGAALPAVGQILGGAMPLLVHSGGIGAIDARSSRIEPVFEAESGLNAVARLGEVLALAEKMAPDKQFPKGGVEWTVLDYGSGEILGQLLLAGPPAEGLELRATTGKGIEALLLRTVGGKRMALVAQIRDASGQPAAKNGAMSAKVKDVPASATAASTAGCPMLTAADAVRADAAGLAVSEDAARNSPATAAGPRAAVAGAGCIAILDPDARGESFGWFAAKAGKAELRAVHCRNP